MKLPVSVIILTFNEEVNIRQCLDSVTGWADEIFVVDSGSRDRTLEYARQYTDKVYTHPFENYAIQRNWAQDNLPVKNEWIFHLDADERASRELESELRGVFQSAQDADGFMMPRKTFFRNRWIRYGGHYPSYHLRLFKKSKGRSEERLYDQNYIVDGRVGTLDGDIINIIANDITALITDNKLTLEAKEALSGNKGRMNSKFGGNPIERINWLRYKVYYKAPLFIRPFAYYLYRYVLKRGFLDGAAGLVFHFYQGFWLRFLVDLKIFKLRKNYGNTGTNITSS
jgi:glycosyltransferase involved in cell wall biosynthesis